MRGKRGAVLFVSFVSAFAIMGQSLAADFSPTTRFTLSNRKVNANPSLTITVAQDPGEEALDTVVLTIPKGFNLPLDAKIEDGEVLGQGQIKVAAEPLCTDVGPGIDATIKESNRTQNEINSGVRAAWIVDLNFLKVRLAIRGSKANGWKLSGKIPDSAATCPPFSLRVTINQTSSVTNTKIVTNPGTAGTYTFKATWVSVEGTQRVISQNVQITN